MSRMTRDQAVFRLAEGVQADLAACAEVQGLLERQFDAALRHRSGELAALAADLTPALDAMDARRQQRVNLVRALLGAQATMNQLIATLAGPAREELAAHWSELEQMVIACKAMTARNSALLAEQFSIMQRVLHGEEQVYAPR
ncbi:MAG TPA: flagellar export chaperone FlgN [Telluria sp.]